MAPLRLPMPNWCDWMDSRGTPLAKKKRPKQQQAQRSAATEGPALTPEEQAARREQQKREWAARKQAEAKRERGGSPVLWAVLGGSALVGVVVLGIVIFAAGGGGGSSNPTPTNTVDARVAGLTPAQTLVVTANDNGQEVNVTYDKTTLNATAGQPFEIDLKNTGSVHHNLQIDGLDHQFDTNDDWYTDPYGVDPGQTGKVIVKLDTPGTYQYHCSFHPSEQFGTLIIS